LQNQTYLGFVKYKDELLPGKHPPLVSQTLFDASQAARRAKGRMSKVSRGGGQGRVYLLANLLYCGECGSKLHSFGTKHHRYHRCYRAFQQPGACTQRNGARADDLEAEIERLIRDLVLPDDWRQQVNSYLSGGPDLEQVERQRALLEARLERIRRLYIDGDLTEGEYEQERNKTKRELAQLVTPEAVSIEQAAALLRDFSSVWSQATFVEKKKVLREVFRRIVVKDKVIVEVVPRPAFATLFEKFGGKE